MYAINTEKLIALRKAKGYSQAKMGELLVTDRSNYGKIERGETELTLKIAYSLAKVLQVSIDRFVNMPKTDKAEYSQTELLLLLEKAMNLAKSPPHIVNDNNLILAYWLFSSNEGCFKKSSLAAAI
jgi:transcriptional regulator with XRE-family HTH domain